jgi:hypothetical protein
VVLNGLYFVNNVTSKKKESIDEDYIINRMSLPKRVHVVKKSFQQIKPTFAIPFTIPHSY